MNFKCSPIGHLSSFLNFLNSNQVAENMILVHPLFEDRVYLHSAFAFHLWTQTCYMMYMKLNKITITCYRKRNVNIVVDKYVLMLDLVCCILSSITLIISWKLPLNFYIKGRTILQLLRIYRWRNFKFQLFFH